MAEGAAYLCNRVLPEVPLRNHYPDPGHEIGRVMAKSAPATPIRAQPRNRLRLLNPLSTPVDRL